MHVFVVELVRLSALLAQSAWVTASLKSTQISASIAVLAQVHARQALSLRHNLTGKKHILKRKKTTRSMKGVVFLCTAYSPKRLYWNFASGVFLNSRNSFFAFGSFSLSASGKLMVLSSFSFFAFFANFPLPLYCLKSSSMRL